MVRQGRHFKRAEQKSVRIPNHHLFPPRPEHDENINVNRQT